MAITLSQTPKNKVDFLLRPHPYLQLHNRLKNLLSKEEYQFFAIPDILNDITNWSVDISGIDRQFGTRGIKSYNDLSDEEKDEISDYIEAIKEKITAKIKNDSTFETIYKKLFLMPDTKDIKIVKTEDGIIPVITQWGCKSNETSSSIDPLAVVIDRPRTNSAKVIVQINYTDGSKAADRDFYFEYNNKPWQHKTNNDGFKNMLRFKIGSQFQVYDLVNGKKAYIKNFEVSQPGDYVALVIFPLLVTGFVKVVNQKDSPLSDREIIIEIEEKDNQTLKTNKSGKIDLDSLEVGKKIKIIEKKNPKNTETFTIAKEQNIFKLVIVCPIPTTATITVKDIDTDEIQLHYQVLVEYEGQKKEYTTGEEGIIRLDNLIEGKEIKISNNKGENLQIHTLKEQNNNYVLRVQIPKPKFQDIKLIEKKYLIPYIFGPERNLENIRVDFKNNKGEIVTRITDKDGVCRALPEDDFDNNQKVEVTIYIPKKNGKEKPKRIKKTFKFNK